MYKMYLFNIIYNYNYIYLFIYNTLILQLD